MRTVLLALAIVSLGGCVRTNPDYDPLAPGGGPGPGTSPGPGASDGGSGGAKDLSQPGPGADLAHAPDLAMSGGDDEVGIRCGMASCVSPQICCATLGARTCVAPGLTSCIGGRALTCDGPEDCGGSGTSGGDKSCCATLSGTVCMSGCPVAQRLCHSDDDCDGDRCCPNDWGYPTCSKHDC